MRDRSLAAVLVICSVGALLAWRSSLGLWGALGTDAPLWGLTAEGLLNGAAPVVPPAYPLLLSLLRRLGLGLIGGGSGLSLVIAATVPGVVFMGARAAGAARWSAIAAALLALCCPDLIAWSAELQSNGLVALGLAATTGAWAGLLARRARWGAKSSPSTGLMLATALLTGLLPLIRENAMLTAMVGVALAPLLLRRGWQLSVAIVAVWWLGPLLVGELPGSSPLDTPWNARGGMALSDLQVGDGPLPNYVGEINRDSRPLYIALLRAGDLPDLAWWHARRSLRIATDGWLVAGAAVVVLLARARRRPAVAAALLPLATIGPALLIWTQRRHVLLALPALLVVIAAAWPGTLAARRPTPGVSAIVAALCLAIASWPMRLSDRAEEQQGSTARAASLAELGAAICREDPVFMGGPIQDVALYCPRPRHDPDGSVADWHTVVVLPEHMAGQQQALGWQPTGAQAAGLSAFALPADGPLPCAGGYAAPDSVWLATGPASGELLGCTP